MQILNAVCEFCNSKSIDPNDMIQILLDSQWGLVFKKNMFWALYVEILDELNRNLKSVFECMQTCLNHILSLCDPKIVKFSG